MDEPTGVAILLLHSDRHILVVNRSARRCEDSTQHAESESVDAIFSLSALYLKRCLALFRNGSGECAPVQATVDPCCRRAECNIVS